jgi:hypothetical protein
MQFVLAVGVAGTPTLDMVAVVVELLGVGLLPILFALLAQVALEAILVDIHDTET